MQRWFVVHLFHLFVVLKVLTDVLEETLVGTAAVADHIHLRKSLKGGASEVSTWYWVLDILQLRI